MEPTPNTIDAQTFRLGVVGAGTMGGGIAQAAAQAGLQVIIRDVSDHALARGMGNISKSLAKLFEKGKIAQPPEIIAQRITTTTAFEDLGHCDVVIEAAFESIEVKREVFSTLDGIVNPQAVLATNTSSLSVTQIAAFTTRPQQVIGLHFFNPVALMLLVEVVRGIHSSQAAIDVGVALASTLGKTPIVCNDQPGFIVNRLLIPYLNDAVCAYAEAVASAQDIDTAMKLGANMPIGPLALADLVGLDVQLAAIESLFAETGDSKFRPHPLLRQMVRAGKLGRKTGEGFYRY
jgi:3-hydroxybutyryl-CoA dehydrogenase